MSKMPAKKKSCFQITSVTQAAQMAVSCNTDDTESLDDPDESRTEDVSSEIFDVSRADFDPGVCDRSSSEETLNIVGEVEAAVMALNIPQESVAATGPFNGGHSYRSTGASYVNPPVLPALSQPSIPNSVTQQPTTVNACPAAEVSPSVSHTHPAAAPGAATTTSCSSRFRVIKLDHGTGEPFRRGRWMCTEFYERDSEGSSMNRTADSIKNTVTPEHSADRDSGLGTTGSVVSPGTVTAQVHESSGDSGYSTVHHSHPPEPQQQGFGLAPQTGSGTSAFQPAVYSAAVSQAQVHPPPAVPQTLQPGGLNGVPPGTQAQQFAYSATPPSQLDYRQQHLPPTQGSSSQVLPMASLSGGPLINQGTSPVITPAGAKGPGLVAQSRELAGSLGPLTQSGSGVVMATLPTASAVPVTQNVSATVPGTTNAPPGLPSGAPAGSAGQGLPTAGQGNDGRRRSDAVPQPNTTPGKEIMRPFIPESLHLATPTVNSLLGISIPMDGDEDGSSGASVVAIDNKIEQAMDLVKSHLMYAVREEVEVLKEQIKELYERNSQLERENAVLKSLANTEQLTQLSSSQISPSGSMSPPRHLPAANTPLEGAPQALGLPQQPNVTSA